MNSSFSKYFIVVVVFLGVACKQNAGDKLKVNTKEDSAQISTAGVSKELLELNRKVKENPANPMYYNDRAAYYLKKNELELAYKDIALGFSIDSTNMPLFSTLADYHLLKREPGLAKSALEKALKINPKSVMTHIKLGELYYIVRKYEQAFSSINEGLQINKYYSDGYFWKGMIYKDKGDTAKALSNFQTTVEQDPDNYKAYIQMGVLCLPSLKKEALDHFTAAIRVNPNSTEAYYGRAYYYQLMKQNDKSMKDYLQVVQIDSTYSSAYYNLGILYYEKNSIDTAHANFTKAITFNPKYAEAYYMRGLCAESKLNADGALADFEFAVNVKPNYQLALEGIKRVKRKK